MSKFHLLVAALLSIFLPMQAALADDCSNGLKIATGNASKGYSKLFDDLKKVCGDQVTLCEVHTNGGLDNLNALGTNKADLGFAQIDAWVKIKGGDANVAALQGVARLNFNYLHIIVAANGFTVEGERKLWGLLKGDQKTTVIKRFSELKGYKVALVGAAQLLSRQIDSILGSKMEFVDVETDKAAFDLVRTGQAAATMLVSGWPSGTVGALRQDAGLTLVPFDTVMPDAQTYTVRQISYKSLGVYNNNTLAVPNVLFSRPLRGAKFQEVAKLRQCLDDKLPELQEGSFQPAWNEIEDLNTLNKVPPFDGQDKAPPRGKQ